MARPSRGGLGVVVVALLFPIPLPFPRPAPGIGGRTSGAGEAMWEGEWCGVPRLAVCRLDSSRRRMMSCWCRDVWCGGASRVVSRGQSVLRGVGSVNVQCAMGDECSVCVVGGLQAARELRCWLVSAALGCADLLC